MKKLIALLVLLPSLCFAEPTSSIHYLMNEPLSLFDAGIMKLQFKLDNFCNTINTTDPIAYRSYREKLGQFIIYPYVGYEWDENRIQISLHVFFKNKSLTGDTVKEFSTLLINDLKSALVIKLPNDKDDAIAMENFSSDYFSHSGYKKKGEPKELKKEIFNIIEMNVLTLTTNHLIKARAKLGTPEIMFSNN